ncbi:hypothetical protein Taro_044025 [Colocasia esculenta]|uniref:Cysteine-rich receptor-like protein kinase 10 n=1 Tax=Colocasia esculenta TaxID=4460 RepID=A0A843WKU8_COLES|nr:hypothetical protein [Colocasia esculenta]
MEAAMAKLSVSLLVVALLQTLAVVPAQAQIFLWCSGDTNYTATSPFKRNLDLLLLNLSTVPATAQRGHFHSVSLDGPGAAYGLVQCRGDILPNECAACLNGSASEITGRCPLRRGAAIRHDLCLLRYSDRPFLGVPEHGIKNHIANGQNTSDSNPVVFDRQMMELVAEVTTQASAGASRFAAGMRNYTYFRHIYAIAQCTRDLPEAGCNQCLRDLIPSLPSGRIGAQVSTASCFLRFEIYPFFSLSVVPPPPAPLLQPAPSPPTAMDNRGKRNKSPTVLLIIVIVSVVTAVVSSLANTVICLRRRSVKVEPIVEKSAESLLFDFETLRVATGNFCEANKLGEGGFGPVYMGFLPDGQQIAVKRLSGRSTQGLAELRNEVVLVAKLHHRNLVRLLGFCLEEEEKIVVYEYLPNTSLDKFLFDPNNRLLLDWERRCKLIAGIARGLLYLHEDSRLRIIHRDLKASNILLDEHMNPKISDFGLAKLFAADETHGRTSRIAGTYGYMAPEYAMHGHFSVKLDVFSFGVLTLEIVTGQRNNSFDESDNAIDLLGSVWNHWNEGEALQLLDPTAGDRCQTQEVLRWIHIGLLCVQEDPSVRPNMSEVVLMLSSFSLTLPAPSKPAFVIRGSVTNSELNSRPSKNNSGSPENENPNQSMVRPRVQSLNQVTMSDIEPR